jgi:hypothetical protein
MPDPRFLHLDLLDLLARLTATAFKWQAQRGLVLQGTGSSADDLAQTAILEVLRKESLWKPEASEEELFKILLKIMWRDFLDLIKSASYTTQVGFHEIPETPDPTDDYISAEAAILASQLYPLVGDAPALKDYIDAVLMFGYTKREDIAAFLQITPRDASDRRAKLRVLLASWHDSVSSKKGNSYVQE